MIGVTVKDLLIRRFCRLKILLLLMNMSDLEENVRLIQR